MKWDKKWFRKRWFGYVVAACAAVALFLLLSNLNIIGRGFLGIFRILAPVLLGIVIAYILDPFTVFFEKKVFKNVRSERLRRNLSVFLGVLVVFCLIALLLVALIPQLINSVKVLFSNLQGYMDAINRFTDFIGKEREGVDLAWLARLINSLTEKARDSLLARSDTILHGSIRLGKGVITFGISIIVAIYFLAAKRQVQNGVKKFCKETMSEKRYNFLGSYWNRCNQILMRYILFNLLDGLIVGVANAIFMSVLRMPYVALISVIVGVTNLVPTFGPLVGGAIGAFILVIVNPWHALWFIIFSVGVQIFDGYILKPKLYGNTFGVPALWVLIMIIIGGRMFGLIGILVAIPLSAILSFTFREYFWPWMKRRRERKLAEKEKEAEGEEKEGKA